MKFLDPNLDLRMLDDGRHFQSLAEFDYHIGSPAGTSIVRCEAGAISDFASSPRILWPILPPWGRYAKGCFLHDELYRSGHVWDTLTEQWVTIDRKYADGVLAESCRVLAANEMLTYGAQHTELADYCDRVLLYEGVRLFAGPVWNRYRQQGTGRTAA